MVTEKEHLLIVKYLTRQATSLELDAFSLWLKDASNEKEFINYLKINYAIDFNMKNFDSIHSKKQLIELIDKDKKVHKLRVVKKICSIAAIALVFLALGYYYKTGALLNAPSHTIKSETITLQLENGDIEIINETESLIIKDKNGNVVGSQNGTHLAYHNNSNQETLIYNTLNIPYGKRFKIQLSDGTIVHLNAGTTLKYPVKFIKGESRKVFLKGEAYFEVATDAKHPFIVDSEDLDVEVTGTKFNVSSYPEDASIDVVLVEGSVNLNIDSHDEKLPLKPGYNGSLNKKNGVISTKPVVTNIYTSWVYGELFFRNITFENILKKMERHYNVTIINKNLKLGQEEFNASFREVPIEKIFEYFKITYNIKYTITDNNITIH